MSRKRTASDAGLDSNREHSPPANTLLLHCKDLLATLYQQSLVDSLVAFSHHPQNRLSRMNKPTLLAICDELSPANLLLLFNTVKSDISNGTLKQRVLSSLPRAKKRRTLESV